MKVKQWTIRLVGMVCAGAALLLTAGCGSSDQVVQVGTTDIFTQDLNPPFLDILWVVDNRSGMKDAHAHLVSEMQSFFKRLDSATSAYRMAYVTADMEVNPAQIYPTDGPFGKATAGETPDVRAQFFGDIVANSLDVNLKTGGKDQGLKSMWAVLADSTKFPPRTNVPLVVMMVSDSDDVSDDVPAGTDAVDFYEQRLLGLKGGNRSLVRVYAANYVDLPAGVDPNSDASAPYRCATRFHADRDNTATFQDRYFRLAKRFATGIANPNAVTADLCQSFSDKIDISGLRLKELPKRFPLSKTPQPDTITVTVVRKATGETYPDLKWSYVASTNEIVFEQTPPEGTSVVVTYHTN